jgi:hypothetical protein
MFKYSTKKNLALWSFKETSLSNFAKVNTSITFNVFPNVFIKNSVLPSLVKKL